MKKYQNIDILAFLEEQMKKNTKYYQSDFEIDRKTFARAAASERPEDKVMLWLSRPMGTQLVKEHDAFIRDTAAHNTWRFYAEQTMDKIAAFTVEIIGEADGILEGSVYELDYRAHAAEVAAKSVLPQQEEKTFADGTRVTIPFKTIHPELYELTCVHGAVKDTFTIPTDADSLADILADQKANRSAMKPGIFIPPLGVMSLASQTAYNEVKEQNPDAIVCFCASQHGRFEIYGEDAKKAAPILGSKILIKELEGGGKVPVTGFREQEWISKSKKLWAQGNDVLLTQAGVDGRQETIKHLCAEDFIPVGMALNMEGRNVVVDSVDFETDDVMLTGITNPKQPQTFHESVAVVRSYVEDAPITDLWAAIDRREDRKKSTLSPRKSVMAKLKRCSKEAQARESQKPQREKNPKIKEREM